MTKSEWWEDVLIHHLSIRLLSSLVIFASFFARE